MPTVSTDADAYQDLERIRSRIDHEATDFFDGPNAELRFDELLVELEREARDIFVTLWGDQTPLTETGRVDCVRAQTVAAQQLVYPINDIQQVEYKRTNGSDYEVLDTDWYDFSEHSLILARRPNTNALRVAQRRNPATAAAERATWADLASTLRVSYDRGFGDTPPADIQSLQIQLITNFLRKRKAEQTLSAASPDEMAQAMTADMVVTEEIRQRVGDVTSPGLGTLVI